MLPVLVTVHAPDEARLMTRHDPRVYGDRVPSLRVDDVNAGIESVARERHLALAGFHDALRLAGGADAAVSTDGVHLTAAGYALRRHGAGTGELHRWPRGSRGLQREPGRCQPQHSETQFLFKSSAVDIDHSNASMTLTAPNTVICALSRLPKLYK